jgi:hypothetical protein
MDRGRRSMNISKSGYGSKQQSLITHPNGQVPEVFKERIFKAVIITNQFEQKVVILWQPKRIKVEAL